MGGLYTRERGGSRGVGAGWRRLAKAVGAGAEEGEEAEVAEDLELLADFGTQVTAIDSSGRRA